MIFSFIIWNGNPEIFSIGSFALRWYGLLFALGFLISQQVLYYIYKKEGKPQSDVDTLTIYMVVATVLGARMGHIIFYQPEMFIENPLGIILPFEFSPFRFTGFQGLASHGGAFGILFALWIYSRYSIEFSKPEVKVAAKSGKEGKVKKKNRIGLFIQRRSKPGQNYLQVLDRIVIVVALTGALIRLGNFFNAEIIGVPTNSPLGVAFVSKITEHANNDRPGNLIESIEYKKDETLPAGAHGRMPINIYLFFKKDTKEAQIPGFIDGDVKLWLADDSEFFDEPRGVKMRYEVLKEENGQFAARIKTFAIVRHPAQLYESGSCVLLFLFLFWYWSKYKENTPDGRIFGFFLVILWSLRFAYEFLKKNQVDFEENMTLNMGQILSIPLVITGILVLIYSYRYQPKHQELESPPSEKV